MPPTQAEWLDVLDKALLRSVEKDIVVAYNKVALAFPSASPHPDSFDYHIIDFQALQDWATPKGWFVRVAPDMALSTQKCSPPVRFTRK